MRKYSHLGSTLNAILLQYIQYVCHIICNLYKSNNDTFSSVDLFIKLLLFCLYYNFSNLMVFFNQKNCAVPMVASTSVCIAELV